MNKSKPLGKGIRTAVQSIVGVFVGLIAAVWAIPGVPEAVLEYMYSNALPLALSFGVPAGLVAFLQNLYEDKVRG